MKDDEVKYQNLIMSMTSVNIKPVIRNSPESMIEFKGASFSRAREDMDKSNKKEAKSHQIIAEVPLSMSSKEEEN